RPADHLERHLDAGLLGELLQDGREHLLVVLEAGALVRGPVGERSGRVVGAAAARAGAAGGEAGGGRGGERGSGQKCASSHRRTPWCAVIGERSQRGTVRTAAPTCTGRPKLNRFELNRFGEYGAPTMGCQRRQVTEPSRRRD